eukprot:3935073-Rhodomonas_salina.1
MSPGLVLSCRSEDEVGHANGVVLQPELLVELLKVRPVPPPPSVITSKLCRGVRVQGKGLRLPPLQDQNKTKQNKTFPSQAQTVPGLGKGPVFFL